MKRLSFVDIGNVRLCALLLVSVLLMAVPALAMAEEGGNYPMLQYDAQRTGNVSGIAPETDTLLWQSNEKTAGCIEAGPIVSDGKVYISTWWSAGMGVEGNAVDALYCLDEDTGEEIWNNTEVYGASTAAIAEGKLFVGTHRGNITCVDATSGAILWSKKIEEEFWGGVTSSPLVFGDEVYVLSVSNGTLHAFSFGGTELWNFSSGGEIFCYSSPSAYDNKIFFAGNDSGQHALYCLDLNTRGEVWKFTTETEIRGSPTIWGEEGMVFFTTKYVYGKARKLYVVDITTGEEIWNVTHYSSWASPALSNGKLYIGGSAVDTAFYCYDAGDGTLIWENEEMEGAIDSSPVVADGKVYFGTNEVDGTVYALDANSGSIIWDYTLYVPSEFGGGYNIASPPAISDRTLFIGVDNVGVLAFRYSVFWGGDVTLIENTTVNVTAYNSGESYAINQTTALGALDAAADAGEFNYTVSDEWYTSYGSFLLTSIAGIENEPWPGDTWYIYINNESAPYGLGLNTVENGDTVSFFYGEYGIPDNASMVIRIHVHVQSPAFWEGEITLTENTTFNVTAHNSGESYEINQTTALGALDAAAEAGGFNYTVSDEWYASWGSLMVDSIAGKENDPVTWDGWLYWVNYPDDPMPMVGVNLYEVEDGDVVTYYYGGMSTAPDNSPMVIRIHVHVQSPVLWEGEVTLIENITANVTAHNSGESYEINQTTALGALDAAAEAGGFNYTVSDEWYASWGSLMVDSIAGKANDPVTWDGWLYWVNYPNDPMPMVGVNLYEVEDGDVVAYYYGGMSTTPDNSPMVIRIHVHVQSPVLWEGEVTLVENATANVTAYNSGERYEINQTTALGALDAAAEAGGFNYTVSDEWYASWGSLMVDSIAGKENDPVTWDGWLYWVNYPDDPMPMVGVNLYEVEDGDVVTYYYGRMSTAPDNSPMVIRIHVQSPVSINETEYRKMIPQPVNVNKIHYKFKVVDEEWVAIWTNEILYVQEKTKYSIAIYLDREGYVTSVDFERWGFPTTEIPYDLAVRSLDKLHP